MQSVSPLNKIKLTIVIRMLMVILVLGATTAQAHPGKHRHVHGRTVVVERNVVVNPAPVRNLVASAIGDIVTDLPASHRRISFQGRTYFVADGLFFNRHARGYVVVRPVAGLRMATLPRGFTTVRQGGTVRYRYRGVTYRRVGGYYFVV